MAVWWFFYSHCWDTLISWAFHSLTEYYLVALREPSDWRHLQSLLLFRAFGGSKWTAGMNHSQLLCMLKKRQYCKQACCRVHTCSSANISVSHTVSPEKHFIIIAAQHHTISVRVNIHGSGLRPSIGFIFWPDCFLLTQTTGFITFKTRYPKRSIVVWQHLQFMCNSRSRLRPPKKLQTI